LDGANAPIDRTGMARVAGRIAKLTDLKRTVDIALRALYPGEPVGRK